MPSSFANPHNTLDERALALLKWRCRRGLLENDLLIERFFTAHNARIDQRLAQGLERLMALDDHDLLDLLLRRREPHAEIDCEAVRAVLPLLRPCSELHPTAATTH